MLAKISPWGVTAFALAAIGLLCASLMNVRPLTIALAGLGLVTIIPGLMGCRRNGSTRDWIWLALGGILSGIVLGLALTNPGLLNHSWVRDGKVPQHDPNLQMLVPVERPMEPGKPLPTDAWVDAATEGIRQDDMFVRVETVKIGQLPEKGLTSFLLVQFRLTQIMPVLNGSFQGFANDRLKPVLVDDTGRAYLFLGHRSRKPFPSKFDFALNVDHWLIYELPAGGSGPLKIESLKLEVPAAAWGRQGMCRFLIKTIEADAAPDVPKLIAHYKGILNQMSRPPDVALGRKIFVKQCMECHTLFGMGGKIGPELTDLKTPDGRLKRGDLDFLVTNIVDPSAEIAKEFLPSLVITTSGQVIIGIIKEQTAEILTLQTSSKKVEVRKKDIEEIRETKVSLMPMELLKSLDDHEVRSLFAYLSGPVQAPLLASHENFIYFFLGNDLITWKNSGSLWKLDKGEILPPGPQAGKPAHLISDLLLADDFQVTLQFHPGKVGRGAILIQDEDSLDHPPSGPRIEVAAGEAPVLVDRKGSRHPAPPGKDGGTVQADTWNMLDIIMKGKDLRIKLQGKDVLTHEDSVDSVRRRIILEGSPNGASEIRFRNLDLRLLSAPQRNP